MTNLHIVYFHIFSQIGYVITKKGILVFFRFFYRNEGGVIIVKDLPGFDEVSARKLIL